MSNSADLDSNPSKTRVLDGKRKRFISLKMFRKKVLTYNMSHPSLSLRGCIFFIVKCPCNNYTVSTSLWSVHFIMIIIILTDSLSVFEGCRENDLRPVRWRERERVPSCSKNYLLSLSDSTLSCSTTVLRGQTIWANGHSSIYIF